jgi:hypothetical protein
MIGAFCWWASAGGSPRSGAGRNRPILLLFLLGLAGCGRHAAAVPANLPAWLRTDPQRCLLARDLGENMEAMARRCAELFVAENGYTDLPATPDSTRWVLEAGDRGPWPRVLASRGRMLERDAALVQCSARRCMVFFRAPRVPHRCAYRVVSMTQVFTRLMLEPATVLETRCAERRA